MRSREPFGCELVVDAVEAVEGEQARTRTTPKQLWLAAAGISSEMYATSLPPRPNPHARIAENYAPRFSPDELPLLPANWIPSWRSPPSKIWGDVGVKRSDNGTTAAAASYASAATSAARPQTTG